MGRAADTDSLVGNDLNPSSRLSKTMILIAAQIQLVVSVGNSQCLRQLSRTRTKPVNIMDVPSLPHQRDSASWLERTDENKTVFLSFHQNVQHPVNAVIEINVGRPSVISLDEGACSRAHKAMTSFVTDCVIGFRFNDQPSARIPIELATDKITGTAQRIALEKISPQRFASLCRHC
jgi:hypothetical protein